MKKPISIHSTQDAFSWRRHSWRIVGVFLTVLILLGNWDLRLAAQESSPSPAQTAGNSDVDIPVLKHMVKPLDQAELEVEVGAWQDLVKTKSSEISELEIELLDTEITPDRKAEVEKQLTDAGAELTRLKDRYTIILAAFKAKGGEVENYEQYLQVVTSFDVDVQDVNQVTSKVKRWLVSPEGGIRWGKTRNSNKSSRNRSMRLGGRNAMMATSILRY